MDVPSWCVSHRVGEARRPEQRMCRLSLLLSFVARAGLMQATRDARRSRLGLDSCPHWAHRQTALGGQMGQHM